jgi:hypothetical protein
MRGRRGRGFVASTTRCGRTARWATRRPGSSVRHARGRGFSKGRLPQFSDICITFVTYSHLTWTKKRGAAHSTGGSRTCSMMPTGRDRRRSVDGSWRRCRRSMPESWPGRSQNWSPRCLEAGLEGGGLDRLADRSQLALDDDPTARQSAEGRGLRQSRDHSSTRPVRLLDALIPPPSIDPSHGRTRPSRRAGDARMLKG